MSFVALKRLSLCSMTSSKGFVVGGIRVSDKNGNNKSNLAQCFLDGGG